jgi:hypothetical protein
MRAKSNAIVVIGLGLLTIAGARQGPGYITALAEIDAAQAQTPVILTIALKSGETQDLGPIYSIRLCRSTSIAKPEVEILEGPPDITVTIKEEDIVPRAQGCANKVPGGRLLITAPKEIVDPSFTRLAVRITYKTDDGDEKRSLIYNLSLIP